METKFNIYRKSAVAIGGNSQELTTLIGSLTRDEVVKSLDMSVRQRDRMQELVDATTRKLELIDAAIINNEDSIVL